MADHSLNHLSSAADRVLWHDVMCAFYIEDNADNEPLSEQFVSESAVNNPRRYDNGLSVGFLYEILVKLSLIAHRCQVDNREETVVCHVLQSTFTLTRRTTPFFSTGTHSTWIKLY